MHPAGPGGEPTQSQADAISVILRKQVGCLRVYGGAQQANDTCPMNTVGERGAFPAP
jgi:hypothetical protein